MLIYWYRPTNVVWKRMEQNYSYQVLSVKWEIFKEVEWRREDNDPSLPDPFIKEKLPLLARSYFLIMLHSEN